MGTLHEIRTQITLLDAELKNLAKGDPRGSEIGEKIRELELEYKVLRAATAHDFWRR